MRRAPPVGVARRLLGAVMLLGACAEGRGPQSSAEAPQTSTKGARLDTATAAFLELFEAPPDTVRLRGETALRLWDRLIVAEAPSFDPLREMNVAATRWEQIHGDAVRLDAASSLDATAHLPVASVPTHYVFRLTMRNTSGERVVRLPVLVQP